MLVLRKLDYYGQLILAGIIVSSCFILLSNRGFLVGLLFLGSWQVTSAILNSHCFVQSGFTNKIFFYWIFCAAELVLFLLSSWQGLFIGNVGIDILFAVSLAGAFAVAGYYWWIYSRLIAFLFIRDELDGLTKSKH
jgi:hypothetical protein